MTSIFNRAAKIGLVSLLGIAGISGCEKGPAHKEYEFHGEIGNEEVEFEQGFANWKNYLYVTREDSTKIVYRSNWPGGSQKLSETLDLVIINKNGQKKKYNTYQNPELIALAQKQFDAYLKRILEIKDSTRKADEAQALGILGGK